MASKPILIIDRQKVRSKMEKTDKEVETYIDIIKNWIKKQPHLPEVPGDELIEFFLVTNKFSIERTKPKLDMYYTVRNLFPEIYRNQTPDMPHMKQTANVVLYCPLPKLTEELYRVSILKFVGDPNILTPCNLFSYHANINEIRLHEDLNTGDVIIIDIGQMTMAHVVKFTPVQVKKAVFTLEEVFSNRLKGIHFINSPRFADIFVTILKSVMKPKMISRIHVHTSWEDLTKYVSKDILPKDYGGNEISLQELHDLWLGRLEAYKDRFHLLDKIEIDENLRPTPLKNDELLGFHGNFKKLDID